MPAFARARENRQQPANDVANQCPDARNPEDPLADELDNLHQADKESPLGWEHQQQDCASQPADTRDDSHIDQERSQIPGFPGGFAIVGPEIRQTFACSIVNVHHKHSPFPHYLEPK